ncbi:substrate-binding periplasmic protein [Thalassotalea piscium]|uniref:Solute-binding protein family 3/N-terminal domain-containing protein n=1 Tax=Thalassotalea piscium TaxID=1230533 RepID=A0A7X0NIT3_9GAMM|nr:transporter substrate-binding domain-containing protein [Thalassotalea piscium]MBB6544163.1 hypothetical protein [Thalassotalea piscium]
MSAKFNFYWLLSLTILFAPISAKSDQVKDTDIIWATDTWINFTNKDGTGFYHEVMAKVFEGSAYNLTVEYLPWKRSLFYVKTNKANVSGALPKNDEYLFADIPILIQPLSILTRTSNQNLTLDQIQHLVGVYPEMHFDEVMQPDIVSYINGVSAHNRQDALALLQKGKVDYYLDARTVLEIKLASLPKEEQEKYHLQDLSKLSLYLVFSKDEKGRALKKYYDNTTKRLLADNELQPLYQKYHLIIP